MSQPFYIDQFWRHFHGRGHDSLSGTTPTTLASAASAGDLSLAATSASGFTVGELIVVGSGSIWQSFTISGISGNTISVLPKVQTGGFAGGATVAHGWGDDAHPGSANAYLAIAVIMAAIKQGECRAGRNRLGPLLGQLESTYTDARSVANVPTRWESLGTATFAVTTYSTADLQPTARNGSAVEIQAAAIGDGMRSLIPIPVTAGERYMVTAQTRALAGTGFQMQVVDANSPSTVIGQLAEVIGGNASKNWGVFAWPSVVQITIPSGVTRAEIRFVSTGTTDKLGVDDVRFIPDRQLSGEDRYLFEQPYASQGFVWLGDSWASVGATGVALQFQTQVQNRLGVSVPYQNSGVTGNKLDDMIARFETDVRPYNPGYCIIEYGANDLSAAESESLMESNADQIIILCRSARIIPVFLGLPPYQPQITIAQARNEQVRARIDNAVFEPGWRNENGPPPPDKQ